MAIVDAASERHAVSEILRHLVANHYYGEIISAADAQCFIKQNLRGKKPQDFNWA